MWTCDDVCLQVGSYTTCHSVPLLLLDTFDTLEPVPVLHDFEFPAHALLSLCAVEFGQRHKEHLLAPSIQCCCLGGCFGQIQWAPRFLVIRLSANESFGVLGSKVKSASKRYSAFERGSSLDEFCCCAPSNLMFTSF